MQVNPYLFFDSNCEAAFKFYEKVLGGKIELLLRNSEGPPEMGTAESDSDNNAVGLTLTVTDLETPP